METILIVLFISIAYVLMPVPLSLYSILTVPKRTKTMHYAEMVQLSTTADYHTSTVDVESKEDNGKKFLEIPV